MTCHFPQRRTLICLLPHFAEFPQTAMAREIEWMKANTTRNAVILARGLGTRMRKADPAAVLGSEETAAAEAGMKGMIPIGRPFLDYVISALADAGYERVCLVIGPEHGAVVEHYTPESPPTRIAIEFAIQEKPLGTADAVLAAEKFCSDESFIVLNSDNYYPAEALQSLRSIAPPAIVGFARSALIAGGNDLSGRVTRFGALTIDSEGILVSIVPRPGATVASSDGEVWASMNCWLFDARIFEACRRVPLSARNERELPQAVQLAIDTMNMRFKVVKIVKPVLDLSTRADIATVRAKLEHVKANL
jgi:glucose-1-phosphate thymidylyltransferase